MKRKPDIKSEAFMCELFGMAPKQFRVLAQREGFHVAKVSNKTRLYDYNDVVDLFFHLLHN